MNSTTALPEAKSQTLIKETPPPQSFLARFQRWEWILVGLIVLVVILIVRPQGLAGRIGYA